MRKWFLQMEHFAVKHREEFHDLGEGVEKRERLEDSKVDLFHFETLGRLIHRLKGNCEVSDDFQEKLWDFLKMRNRFVHGLMMEPEFSLGSDEGIENVEKIVSDIEFHCWFIDTILMGYIIVFGKVLGLEHDDSTITERDRHKYFTSELNLREKDS